MAPQAQIQGPIQIPLAVDLERRRSPTALISGIVNGYIMHSKNSDTKYVQRRGGYKSIDYAVPDAATSPVRGFIYIRKYDEIALIYRKQTGSVDHLYLNGTTYNLTETCSKYDMTHVESLGVHYLYIIGSVSSSSGTECAWVFNLGTTTLTKLSNATHGLPADYYVRGAVTLDTYAFLLTTSGKLYNSNVGDILTWTSTDFLQVSNAEDEKLIMVKHHDHIAVLGSQNITFYEDVGNPNGSPLAFRKDLTIPVGIFAQVSVGFQSTASSIAYDDQHIVFAGSYNNNDTTTGEEPVAGLFLVENFSIKEISTPYIREMLNSASTRLVHIQVAAGRKFVILELGNQYGGSPVYDMSTGFWHLWKFGSTLSSLNFAAMSGPYAVGLTYGDIVVYDETFTYDEYYSGTGSPSTQYYDYDIVVPQVTLGSSNNKLCRRTSLIGDHTTSQCDVEISWTDNSYNSYSTARIYNLQYHRKLTRCGSFRKRGFKIHQDSSNTGVGKVIRLSHIEIDVDITSANVMD